MTDKTVGRTLVLCLILAGLCLLASCGAEAPWFAAVDPEDFGEILVKSTPEGAAIYLDGDDQMATTPHTLTGLDPGTYQVTVELADHDSDPDMISVNLVSAETDSAVFLLTPRLNALHRLVAGNPRAAEIEIPLPSPEGLEAVLGVLLDECPRSLSGFKDDLGKPAGRLAGTSVAALEATLRQSEHGGRVLNDADLGAMRRALVERDAESLIEFVEPDRTLDDVIG